MKKVLLSTTALVAAGLLVTSVAYAQDEDMAEEEMMAEPVSVGISGTALVALSVSDQDGTPDMFEHFEPVISGSATMDNGLTFTVSMVIDQGGTWFNAGQAYDRYIGVGGAFGDIEIGDRKGARAQMRIASAGATTNFGVNGPYWGGVATTVTTDNPGHGAANRQTKIVYKSPAVGGLQLGVSYAPDGAVSESIAAALTFSQDLGDASVSVNVGYETGDDGMGNSPTDLNAGASVSVGDVTVSGGMRDSSDDNGTESTVTDIGAVVAMGALSVSAGWGSSDTSDMYALGAAYPLGEGVQLGMQVDFGEAGGSDWVQFMIGTAVSF